MRSVSINDLPKLRECPFCGGEAVMMHDEWTVLIHGREEYRHDWYVGCDPRRPFGCRGSLYNMETGFDTEDEAISAWNTRAERTCHADLNAGRNAVVCSECGSSMLLESWEELIDWGGNVLINTFKTYPYCPNCGAKVVNENKQVEVWQPSSADDVTCYEVKE